MLVFIEGSPVRPKTTDIDIMYAENLKLLTIITLECFYSHSTKLKAAGPAAAVRVPVTFFAGPGFPARVKWPRSLRLEPSSLALLCRVCTLTTSDPPGPLESPGLLRIVGLGRPQSGPG